jgi:hypothetical protein
MPAFASTSVLGTLGLALLAVLVDPLWRWTSKLETLVHEAGHATTLLVTGNWPTGVILHPGAWSGGETGLPKGRQVWWPSAIVAAMAGYTAPPVAGLVLARAADRGWSPAGVLGTLLVVLVVLAIFQENWTTLLVITFTGLLLGLFLWRAGGAAQTGAVTALAWFLLFAGLRTLWEIGHMSAGKIRDFSYLAERTSLPAGFWFLAAALVAIFSLIAGARWLLY